MSDKNKHFLAAGGFILIFGGLLVLATAFDLQVSFILAAPNLVPDRYFSTSFMCNLVEVVAMAPIWGFATFAASVLTVFFSPEGWSCTAFADFVLRAVSVRRGFSAEGHDEIFAPDSGQGGDYEADLVWSVDGGLWIAGHSADIGTGREMD